MCMTYNWILMNFTCWLVTVDHLNFQYRSLLLLKQHIYLLFNSRCYLICCRFYFSFPDLFTCKTLNLSLEALLILAVKIVMPPGLSLKTLSPKTVSAQILLLLFQSQQYWNSLYVISALIIYLISLGQFVLPISWPQIYVILLW